LASAFSPAEVRRAQVAELRASLDSGRKTIKESWWSLERDPVPSLLRQARRGRWAEVDKAVGRAKARNASKLDKCATSSSKLDRAMNLRFDFAESEQVFDDKTRQAISTRLPRVAKGSPRVKAFLAGRKSRFDPVGDATGSTATTLREIWMRHLQRTAYLDRVRAVARFNQPASTGREVDSSELVRTALSGLRERLSKGATLATASWADYMAASASQSLGDAIAYAAGLDDDVAFEESIAAADSIRELQWLIAALRNVEWRCLWPTVGEADRLQNAATLSLRGESAVRARSAGAVARRRPRSGALVAVVGEVTELEISHEARGKSVTWIALQDRGDDQTVSAKITGFKGDTTGLVVGSAARIAGTWRRSGNNRWVQVERRAISQEAKRSFRAFLEWESRKVWMAVPHGLMVAPSWVPGFDGPLNPVRFKTGHAD
jgi:hypothetical protein